LQTRSKPGNDNDRHLAGHRAVSPSLNCSGARLDPPKHREVETRDELSRSLGKVQLGQRKDTSMNTGTVKFYNDQKGFGFIQPDDGGKDVFVHATALERAGMRGLVQGQKVAFDIQQDRRTGKLAVGTIQAA